MAIPIPGEVRQLLDAPNYVHLSTLRADGSPRNWLVWVGLEGDYILVCTSAAIWKAKDMRRDPRVAMSVTDAANPYRMAAIQGRVVEVRPDEGCRYMDPISIKRQRVSSACAMDVTAEPGGSIDVVLVLGPRRLDRSQLFRRHPHHVLLPSAVCIGSVRPR
jgi:PPOX class probable F420-dependent enzyme